MTEEAPHVYDTFADTYAEDNPRSSARANYEWPGVDAVLPPLAGRRVLDAACGSGYYANEFNDRGASVVGIDASLGMLAEAQRRYGDDIDFVQTDLRADLPIPSETVDVVVCQLALDHLQEWGAVFDSFARVLTPGGHLVISVDHPFTTYFVIDHEPDDIGNAQASAANYYATERYTKTWGSDADAPVMPMYRRPLAAVTRPLFEAGFSIDAVEEPRPTVDSPPLTYFDERTPRFLVVRARLPYSSSSGRDGTER